MSKAQKSLYTIRAKKTVLRVVYPVDRFRLTMFCHSIPDYCLL